MENPTGLNVPIIRLVDSPYYLEVYYLPRTSKADLSY
jgi:hypothetical protein